jgi:hypothetical protein
MLDIYTHVVWTGLCPKQEKLVYTIKNNDQARMLYNNMRRKSRLGGCGMNIKFLWDEPELETEVTFSATESDL